PRHLRRRVERGRRREHGLDTCPPEPGPPGAMVRPEPRERAASARADPRSGAMLFADRAAHPGRQDGARELRGDRLARAHRPPGPDAPEDEGPARDDVTRTLIA